MNRCIASISESTMSSLLVLCIAEHYCVCITDKPNKESEHSMSNTRRHSLTKNPEIQVSNSSLKQSVILKPVEDRRRLLYFSLVACGRAQERCLLVKTERKELEGIHAEKHSRSIRVLSRMEPVCIHKQFDGR